MQDRVVFMPPLPSKSRVPIACEVTASDAKLGTSSGLINGGNKSLLSIPMSPHPPQGPAGSAFQPRFKGPPKPGQKRTLSFGGAFDVYRPVPERGNLSIEGNRTGEERVIEQDVQRKPPEPAAPDLPALRRQLAQAKTEIRTLTGKLHKRKADLENATAIMNLMLEEQRERRQKEEDRLFERQEEMYNSLVRPVVSIDHSSALRELQETVRALQQKVEEERAAFAADKAALEAKLNIAQNVPPNEAEIEKLKVRVVELEKQIESERHRFSKEKQMVEAEKAGVEMVLSETSIKLHELQTRWEEEQFLVAQSRQFVKNVCQPGFNVVKDASLEPVEKNRSSPTGFVLIPLIILLHGYTLLPNDDRQDVISSYERRAAAL